MCTYVYLFVYIYIQIYMLNIKIVTWFSIQYNELCISYLPSEMRQKLRRMYKHNDIITHIHTHTHTHIY